MISRARRAKAFSARSVQFERIDERGIVGPRSSGDRPRRLRTRGRATIVVGRPQNPSEALAPETLAVPVHARLRFHLDVAENPGGAGQAQVVLVPNPCEVSDWTGDQPQLFKQALRADVFLPLLDDHSTAGTLPQPVTVENPVHARIELDARIERLFPQVG